MPDYKIMPTAKTWIFIGIAVIAVAIGIGFLASMPSVMNIYRTEGRYDLMVKVNAETKEMITRIVSNDFRAIQGVDATLTMFIA